MREQRSFFLGTMLAALALRLFFFVYFPAITDDSRVYAELATNWLEHGTYGQTQGSPPEITACQRTLGYRDIQLSWQAFSGCLEWATSKQFCWLRFCWIWLPA